MPTASSLATLIESGHRLYRAGRAAEALHTLDRASADDRQDRDFLLLYGACLARVRRFDDAVSAFDRLLRIDPDCYEALTWMALLSKRRHGLDAAFDYARRAVELRPDDAAGHGALGECYLAARLPQPAIEALDSAVVIDPESAEHRHNLALALLMSHRHGEAIVQLRQAMALAPRSAQSYLVLASTYALYGMAGQAIGCIEEGLSNLPNSSALHSAAAGAFSMIRNDDAAERHHRRALELSPQGRSGYAAWLLNQGRFEEADALFHAMIEDDDDPAFAYYGLMQSRKSVDDEFVRQMEASLEKRGQGPKGEMFLRYALGRAEESRQRYGEAMAHFDAANRLAQEIYHSGQPIDPDEFVAERRKVRTLYEGVRDRSPQGNPTEIPIFIVGMIRSGTTLLDQIVSSHPSVASGGELRFWIEETLRLTALSSDPGDTELRALSDEYLGYASLLAGITPRITDKMPLNFAYAGVIHLAMPNARFLHIRRHPIDTCLSIWMTFFGQGALFAYDKRNIVAYYREYQRTMEDWRASMPADRLLDLDYEELIAAPEPTIRRVIEFLGLPWDDACLHHDQNAGAINTPSRWQARQPIYRTSVERWRRYEPWLGEFAELLEEA